MSFRIRVAACLWVALCQIGAAQDHPALTPPAGFSVSGTGTERTFDQPVPNGDRIRIRVLVQQSGDPESIAKGPALEEGDQINAQARQDVKTGALNGVSYSVFGKPETIEGVPYTRYRRVMGLRIDGNPAPFAVRADILAKEPKPAQSTLEAMARAMTEWQQKLGGVSTTPPPDTENPATKPTVGGDQVVRLTGGGDLEIKVPAFWGRANLTYGPGNEEILLGPARDVIEKLTTETIAKDKDRIGPYVSITRIQKDTFKDLVDVQLLDIKESLLADYVARMADTGITLTLSSERDEGTLGTRTVISVPFEEKRASGTQHRGRSVFMMHRGSLVIVTASHPLEKFDEGWPDIAKAFDTLMFTGAIETESAPAQPETRTSEPAAPTPDQPAPPTPPAPAPPEPVTARPRPAPPEWTRETRDALKTIEFPLPIPVSVSIPAGWTVLGDVDPARAVNAVLATPSPDGPQEPLGSSLRIEEYGFREELSSINALARLTGLMRLRLEQDARATGLTLAVSGVSEIALSGRSGYAIQYTLRGGDRSASGTFSGTVVDGSVLLIDFRVSSNDVAALNPIANEIMGSLKLTLKEELAPRAFGPYTLLVPAGWELTESENQGGGRNIFVRAPSGVDIRFQTALQRRHDAIDIDVLRRVATGFLVEGLKVLTLRDMAAARRFAAPGGSPGLRFEATQPQMNVLILAYMQAEHMVFALRGAPRGYEGRDLAIAWQIIKSFAAAGVDRNPKADPPRVAGGAVSRRVVFSRAELDGVTPDGSIRPASVFSLALLPDGAASIVSTRGGKREELKGVYRIEGDQLSIEGAGIGRMIYRFADDSETLRGDAPGDMLFRARQDETP